MFSIGMFYTRSSDILEIIKYNNYEWLNNFWNSFCVILGLGNL